MSHVWGANGLAFEYPTPYRVENRFLIIRAGVLIVCALALFWLTGTDAPTPTLTMALNKIERGSTWPHVLAAFVLLVLAGVDLVRAARQRKLLLGSGQPGPLAPELPPHATGTSSGGEWLLSAINTGCFPEAQLEGSYRSILRRMAPQLAYAPAGLQVYLRVRVAQLMAAAGLALVLGAAWAVAPKSPGVPVVALWLGALLSALVAYSAWLADDAPGPATVVAVWVIGAVGSGLLLWVGGRIPQVGLLASAGLPRAAAMLLLCAGVVNLIALLAARAQAVNRPIIDAGPPGATAELSTTEARLASEVDNELIRRWTDGVPNRRFVRRFHSPEAGQGIVLEESQPTLPVSSRDRLPPLPWSSRLWLLLLLVLALLLSLGGGIVWISMASALIESADSPWAGAALAAVLIGVGGWCTRIGHLPAGRIEVRSTLNLFEFMARAEPVASEEVHQRQRLRVRVWGMSSYFFGGSLTNFGGRGLLRMTGDVAAAQRFVEHIGDYVYRSSPHAVGQDVKPAKLHQQAPLERDPVARAQARFCATCGTPRLQGARFCLHCGAPLR